VKHAASVHPEPESNPPQKTLLRAEQIRLQKKKKDEHLLQEEDAHKTSTIFDHASGLSGRESDGRTGNHLTIKEVVQYTLLSSQTTTTRPAVLRKPMVSGGSAAARDKLTLTSRKAQETTAEALRRKASTACRNLSETIR
ncbi:hypothetical protein, partial [Bifidobacterium choloepi]|uniref:hypothetical protein n=1 Tax=Bifidobacterium choloepi TaxID=2614131 RepID=UPI0013CFC79D